MATQRDLADLVSFLKVVGFWPYLSESGRSNDPMRWFQIVRLFFFAQTLVLYFISAYKIGIANFLGKIYAGVVMCTPYLFSQAAFIFCHGRDLQSFVTRMAMTVAKRSEPWEKDIFYSVLDPLWKIVRIVTCYYFFLLTVGFIGPVIYETLATLFLNTEPLHLIVPVEGILPSVEENNIFYYLLLWYSALLLISEFVYFIGLLTILAILVNYIRVEIKILCKKIDEFGRKENFEKEGLLREITEDHITIMRLTELTNKFLAAPLILQNVAAAAAITVFAYALLTSISQGYDSVTTLLFNLNSPMALIMVVFISCYSGEMLHSESLNIYDHLCQIQWYHMPKKCQKDILTIMIQVQRPLFIQFKGNSVDLQAFKQVMNATYSCFMLLKSLA